MRVRVDWPREVARAIVVWHVRAVHHGEQWRAARAHNDQPYAEVQARWYAFCEAKIDQLLDDLGTLRRG